jgi:hypothetical protein
MCSNPHLRDETISKRINLNNWITEGEITETQILKWACKYKNGSLLTVIEVVHNALERAKKQWTHKQMSTKQRRNKIKTIQS